MYNKFDYIEACKKVLNNKKYIRREGWTPGMYLIFRKYAFLIQSNVSYVRDFLSDIDLDEKDWIDYEDYE